MDKETQELYQTNDDILFILNAGTKIGWAEIKPQSINRIIYLSKVLHSFVNDRDSNILDSYHFSVKNMQGPISSIINNSLIDLTSREFVVDLTSGIKLNLSAEELSKRTNATDDPTKNSRQEWFKTIMLLLGKYGENKVFSFTINDPLYVKNVDSNNPKEISFVNHENATYEVLNSFKEAFEESIDDTTSISKEEYLELYFDYVFSQIIK